MKKVKNTTELIKPKLFPKYILGWALKDYLVMIMVNN